jgi:RNA polymerase sigma-70 factor (ECF subfamily)
MPTHLQDEAELVEQAQMGDEDAFSSLYNQCSRTVYRVALNTTHDRQDAEDVLQDAFLEAFMHLRDFRNEARFSTWLTSIAVNEALARLRRRAAQKQISLDTSTEVEGERSTSPEIRDQRDNAEEAYRKLELQAILSNAIGKLTPASRTIVALRYQQKISTEATARLMGLSVPPVKTRLLRARQAMRKALRGFVAPDSVSPAH